jgi:hypothetical protein
MDGAPGPDQVVLVSARSVRYVTCLFCYNFPICVSRYLHSEFGNSQKYRQTCYSDLFHRSECWRSTPMYFR